MYLIQRLLNISKGKVNTDMDLRILNYVTVLLFVLNLTGLTQLSWWLVFAPSIVYLVVFLIVVTIVLKVMLKENMTMEEFNELMKKENKKNK